MKKLVSILSLVLCFSLVFAACGEKNEAVTTPADGEQTAFTLYRSAFEQIESAKSVEMEMKTSLSLEKGSASLPLTMDMKVQKVNDGKNTQLSAESSTNIAGSPMLMEIYYKDGKMYISAGGQKIKTKVDLDDLDNEVGIVIPSFDEENTFKEITLTENKKEKQQIVEFTVNKNFFSELGEEHMGPVLAALQGFGAEEVGITTNSYSGRLVFNNKGTIENIYLALTAAAEVGEQEFKLSYVLETDIQSFNKMEKISFPSDLKEYTDSDDMLLDASK